MLQDTPSASETCVTLHTIGFAELDWSFMQAQANGEKDWRSRHASPVVLHPLCTTADLAPLTRDVCGS